MSQETGVWSVRRAREVSPEPPIIMRRLFTDCLTDLFCADPWWPQHQLGHSCTSIRDEEVEFYHRHEQPCSIDVRLEAVACAVATEPAAVPTLILRNESC